MPRPRIRLIDIASACRVSKTAVVQALSHSPERCELSATTRARIRATAERLGYRPDWRARALAGGLTGSVGLLYATPFPPMGQPGTLMSAVARRLADRGVSLLLVRCLEEASWREVLGERRVDGAIVIDDPPPGLVSSGTLPAPVVLLNVAHHGSLPQVLPDDRAGASEATRRLIALGHRAIVHLTVSGRTVHVSSASARRDGYAGAMSAAGLRPRVVDDRDALEAMLRGAHPPTAVFAYHDELALSTLELAKRIGLRVPGDLAIVGVNNTAETAVASPPLASVEVPVEGVAYAAADLLLDLIAGAESPATPILVPERLVERASLAPPA